MTDLVENEVVEWQHPLKHRWRWELVALTPSTTQVTETFDYGGPARGQVRRLAGSQRQSAPSQRLSASVSGCQRAWLTLLMLKSLTRTGGIAVRVKKSPHSLG